IRAFHVTGVQTCALPILQRCFVRYTDLLSDWRGVASRISGALDLRWPGRSAATEAEIESYLSSGLRHHVAAGQSVTGSSQIDLRSEERRVGEGGRATWTA